MTATQLRRATADDVHAAGEIVFDAFATINIHHNYPPDFPSPEAASVVMGFLFTHPDFYCVVAEEDGRIVGSNCLDERSIIAGVGPITIAPDAQNRGLGLQLMNAVLDRAAEWDAAGVRLVQGAFHSRSLALYSKLGLAAREPLSVMNGLPRQKTVAGCEVRNAVAGDIEACNALAGYIHGFHRGAELREAVQNNLAKVVERHGRISGYCTGFGFFAHAVAETNADLMALLGAAESIHGPGILIPTRNTQLFQWCLANGMRIVMPMTLMTTGLYDTPRGAYLPSILY
jgi:predicted N-acetyltransferase YhbS